MKIHLILLVNLLCFVSFANAQSSPISINTERNDQGVLTFWCENSSYTTCSIKLNFSQIGEFIGANNQLTSEARPGKTKILELKPKPNATNLSYSYNYAFCKGNLRAKPDSSFVYLIPAIEGKSVEVYHVNFIGELFDKKEVNQFAQGFRFANNDTLCASRSGIVSEIKTDGDANSGYYNANRNFIEIAQKDGSLAVYTIPGKLTPLIKEGDRVIAGEPIGFLEAPDNKPRVMLQINYIDRERFSMLDGKISPYVNIHPKFVTQNDAQQLAIGSVNVAKHPEEIITLEMTKKELKKRQEVFAGTKK